MTTGTKKDTEINENLLAAIDAVELNGRLDKLKKRYPLTTSKQRIIPLIA